MTEQLPIGPLQEWIERRLTRYEGVHTDPRRRLASDMGVDTKTVNSWLEGIRYTIRNGESVAVPEKFCDREKVEEALWRVDVFLWELWPSLLDEEAA